MVTHCGGRSLPKAQALLMCLSTDCLPRKQEELMERKQIYQAGPCRRDKTKQCISEFICSLLRDLSNLQLESSPRILGAHEKLGTRRNIEQGLAQDAGGVGGDVYLFFSQSSPRPEESLSPPFFFCLFLMPEIIFNRFKRDGAPAPPWEGKLINAQMRL